MPRWHVTVVPGATEVAVSALLVVLVHWGPPCSDDPVRTVRLPGPWSLAAQSRKGEGSVPYATRKTPSGVHKEGCRARRREVSAQGGDEKPSARSQPANCPSEHSFFPGLGRRVVKKRTPMTSTLSSPRRFTADTKIHEH